MDLDDFKADLTHVIKTCIELQLLKMEKYIQDKDEYMLTIVNNEIQFGNIENINVLGCTIKSKLMLNLNLCLNEGVI